MFTRLTGARENIIPGTRPRFLDPTINWTIRNHKGIVHGQNGKENLTLSRTIRIDQGGWFKLVGTNSYFSELLGRFRVAPLKLESFSICRIERNARFVSSRRENKPKVII